MPATSAGITVGMYLPGIDESEAVRLQDASAALVAKIFAAPIIDPEGQRIVQVRRKIRAEIRAGQDFHSGQAGRTMILRTMNRHLCLSKRRQRQCQSQADQHCADAAFDMQAG